MMLTHRKEQACPQDTALSELHHSTSAPETHKTVPLDRFSTWRRLFSEIFGYGVASAVALSVDVSILKTLVDAMHWHYLPASAMAFIAGATTTYVISTRFVFRRAKARNEFTEFLYFAALGIVGLLVNALVISIAIDVVGAGLIASKLTAAGFTFLTNFVLRRKLILFS